MLVLSLGTSLLAKSGTPTNVEPILVANPNNSVLHLHDIFFNDSDNSILFIDFQAVSDKIINVNILLDEVLMMEDEVTDVPVNTIYEINLDVIRSGKYIVELVTESGIVVHQDLWVE